MVGRGGSTMVKMLLLSPGNSVCVCVSVSNHFYSCSLCTHFTAEYSENVFCANICTKNVQIMAEVRFDGAFGVCGVCVASALNICIENATKKCSSKCFSYFYDNSTVHD